jgi:uncharacterized phage-associated protein
VSLGGNGRGRGAARKFEVKGMGFDEKKATQAAAFLLRLRGGRMAYLKLIKLLYLADREALGRWGDSITTDCYVSMKNGPVVSNIYNLMHQEVKNPYWRQFISPPMGQYELELIGEECPKGALSIAEERILGEIFERYGRMSRWELVDFTHQLPEWKDPGRSSIPIELEDIFRAQNFSEEDIAAMCAERDAAEHANAVLDSVA